MFKNLLNRSAREDAKSHWLHLFDFSRLCIFKCACDAADVGGGWPQQQRADAQRGAVLRARTQQPSMQLQPRKAWKTFNFLILHLSRLRFLLLLTSISFNFVI